MEKREHARYPRTFELTGSADSAEAAGSSDVQARMVATNVSLGGLYCTSNVCFDEMTRLAVTMMIPMGRDSSLEPIAAEAVVVRHRQVPSSTGEDRFELALFFTQLADEAKAKLQGYLKR